MRKPFWNKVNHYWYLEHHGKQIRLSDLGNKDPDGGTRIHPPPDVERAWHKLNREGHPEDMQVQDLFDAFKETITGTDLAKSTNHHLIHFQAFVGPELKVSKLRPYHLSNYIEKKPHWSSSTIRTFVNRIHAALNWGVREGRIEKNPITAVPDYKRQGRFERRKGIVPPNLRKILEDAATPAFRAFLVALRETGCRPSELRRMQIERCFPEQGIAFVPNKTEHQTGDAERTVYLSATMQELVKERIGIRTSGSVFLTTTGRSWTHTNIMAHWDRLKKKVPVPKGVSPYSFRHSFISKAINETNVNPAIVAQLAGHANLQMLLDFYLHEDPEALKKAIEAITKIERPPDSPPETSGGPPPQS